jgi:hypothetical protein
MCEWETRRTIIPLLLQINQLVVRLYATHTKLPIVYTEAAGQRRWHHLELQ